MQIYFEVMQLRQIHSGKFTMRKGGMKDVVRLVAVILVCQLPPDPKTETEPARDFGRKHQRINRSHKEIFKLSVNITLATNKATSTQSNGQRALLTKKFCASRKNLRVLYSYNNTVKTVDPFTNIDITTFKICLICHNNSLCPENFTI